MSNKLAESLSAARQALRETQLEVKMNDLGQFAKSLSVRSNDPNQPGLTITIRGEVKE